MFKQLVRRFCLEGSVNGLKYFYLFPDRISRCFWTLNMISTLFFSVSMTFLLYNRFIIMPTRTTVENEYEPMSKLPFPAITLCSPNQITISSMKHFNKTLVDGKMAIDLEQVLPQLIGFYRLLSNINEGDLYNLQELININRYMVSEVMSILPQSCDQFLKICIFELKRVNCRDLFNPILTEHGLCCIFNNAYYVGKRNQKEFQFEPRMPIAGDNSGILTVITDYEPYDAFDGTLLNAGATKVLFNDWTEFPANDESYSIESYEETFFSVHGTYSYCSDEVATLHARECYFENEKRLPFFLTYRNSDCDHVCFVKNVEKYCNCIPFYMPHFPSQRSCNFTSIPCVMNAKMKLGKNLDESDCNCPRDCISRHYKAERTFGNFAALSYMTVNPYGDITLNISTTIMHFYPDYVYTKLKQETVMSFSTFISNIGGVFGLSLGCSVFSVLEILFSIYTLLKNKLRERLRLHLEQYIKEHTELKAVKN